MEISVEVPIKLADEARRLAFGWANVFRLTDGTPVTDSHRETIDTDEAVAAIEDAVYRYVLESRSGDEEHVNYGVARLVETMVFNAEKREAIARHTATLDVLRSGIPTGDPGFPRAVAVLAAENLLKLGDVIPDGWWVGFRVDDDDVWKRVTDGTYGMFSIVGRALRHSKRGAVT